MTTFEVSPISFLHQLFFFWFRYSPVMTSPLYVPSANNEFDTFEQLKSRMWDYASCKGFRLVQTATKRFKGTQTTRSVVFRCCKSREYHSKKTSDFTKTRAWCPFIVQACYSRRRGSFKISCIIDLNHNHKLDNGTIFYIRLIHFRFKEFEFRSHIFL